MAVKNRVKTVIGGSSACQFYLAGGGLFAPGPDWKAPGTGQRMENTGSMYTVPESLSAASGSYQRATTITWIIMGI